MKKISMLMMTLAVITLFSCSKETMLKDRIQGHTWKYVSTTIIVNGQSSASNLGVGTTVTFKSDGTGSSNPNDGSPETTFNYKVIDDAKHIEVTHTSGNQSGQVDKAKVITNETKKQVWQTTDDDNNCFRFELDRQ